MADNKQIATDVLAAVGGKDNVRNVLHCMTRLRFTLADESIVDDSVVKGIKGVMGTMKQGGMYQVVIGTNVPEVYDELCKIGSFSAEAAIDENLDEDGKFELTPKGILDAALNYLSGAVVPLVPVLMTGGLFKTLGAIFGPTFLGLVPEESSFIFLCNMIYSAAFYFMPILAGFTSAQKLKANPYLGALMGAILIEPSFLALSTTEGAAFSVFGIPAPALGYQQTLIPVLLCIPVLALIERYVNKVMPNSVRTIFAPFVTMLIMIPIALCLLAPLGNYAGTALAAFFDWLGATPFGWLAIMLVAATFPMLVLTGMHVGLMAIAITQYGNIGYDSLFLMAATVQAFTASGVALAVWLKMKDPEQKQLAFGYFITQFIGGVGEPLLYGVFLRYKRPWLGTLIGGAAAGLYAAITHVTFYVFASGLFSPLAFVGGDQANFVNGLIATIIGMVVAFVVTWFFGLTKEQAEGLE